MYLHRHFLPLLFYVFVHKNQSKIEMFSFISTVAMNLTTTTTEMTSTVGMFKKKKKLAHW